MLLELKEISCYKFKHKEAVAFVFTSMFEIALSFENQVLHFIFVVNGTGCRAIHLIKIKHRWKIFIDATRRRLYVYLVTYIAREIVSLAYRSM